MGKWSHKNIWCLDIALSSFRCLNLPIEIFNVPFSFLHTVNLHHCGILVHLEWQNSLIYTSLLCVWHSALLEFYILKITPTALRVLERRCRVLPCWHHVINGLVHTHRSLPAYTPLWPLSGCEVRSYGNNALISSKHLTLGHNFCAKLLETKCALDKSRQKASEKFDLCETFDLYYTVGLSLCIESTAMFTTMFTPNPHRAEPATFQSTLVLESLSNQSDSIHQTATIKLM